MKWIPRTERLPELDVDVLVCYGPPHFQMEVVQLTTIGYGDTGLWWMCDCPADLDEVTHWMPLPEAPEETE